MDFKLFFMVFNCVVFYIWYISNCLKCLHRQNQTQLHLLLHQLPQLLLVQKLHRRLQKYPRLQSQASVSSTKLANSRLPSFQYDFVLQRCWKQILNSMQVHVVLHSWSSINKGIINWAFLGLKTSDARMYYYWMQSMILFAQPYPIVSYSNS